MCVCVCVALFGGSVPGGAGLWVVSFSLLAPILLPGSVPTPGELLCNELTAGQELCLVEAGPEEPRSQ